MLFAFSVGQAFGVLSGFYCILVFYLSVVCIAKDDEVDFSQVHFGAGIIFAVLILLWFLAYCLPTFCPLWLVILVIAVFLVYALEIGLIVKQALLATVLFLVMFLPGFFGILYLLNYPIPGVTGA